MSAAHHRIATRCERPGSRCACTDEEWEHACGTFVLAHSFLPEVFCWRQKVSAKAGEVARETSAYRCESCDHRVQIKAGALINDCEKCGHASFRTGWNVPFRSARAQADALFGRL
jgi:ribosomal protein L37AE/L43A